MPFSVCRRTRPKIHSHIKHFTADHANQFILRIVYLKMQSPQYTFSGCRLIILYKFHIPASL